MDWSRNTKGVRVVRRVRAILRELQDYLPLTLRQIHYQLVQENLPGYSNTQNSYKQLSSWLYDARVDGLIPWDAMTDRLRQFVDLSGYETPEQWLETCRNYARHGYSRNLMQTQGHRLEIWTEKDALYQVLRRYAGPYRVSVVVCRGFGSGSQFHDVVARSEKPLRILYFGDHDPSGMWISERDIKPRLNDKHGLEVTLERVALNPGQVQGLNVDPQPPKETDSRSRWYVRQYGLACWELDALPPNRLGELVREAIERNIDMDLFREERARQGADQQAIEATVDGWTA